MVLELVPTAAIAVGALAGTLIAGAIVRATVTAKRRVAGAPDDAARERIARDWARDAAQWLIGAGLLAAGVALIVVAAAPDGLRRGWWMPALLAAMALLSYPSVERRYRRYARWVLGVEIK